MRPRKKPWLGMAAPLIQAPHDVVIIVSGPEIPFQHFRQLVAQFGHGDGILLAENIVRTSTSLLPSPFQCPIQFS